MGRLLTIDEVAERLTIRKPHVYSLIKQGKLPGVVRLGRALRIHETHLENFVARGGTEPELGDGGSGNGSPEMDSGAPPPWFATDEVERDLGDRGPDLEAWEELVRDAREPGPGIS